MLQFKTSPNHTENTEIHCFFTYYLDIFKL